MTMATLKHVANIYFIIGWGFATLYGLLLQIRAHFQIRRGTYPGFWRFSLTLWQGMSVWMFAWPIALWRVLWNVVEVS
jgi:hypothetical protein